MLLVGNHSGGNMHARHDRLHARLLTYFGVERPFYQLAHNLVLASPVGPDPAPLRHRRRLARERAQGARRRRGGARLSRAATGRSTARAGSATGSTSPGRKGFIRLALDAGRADRPGGLDRRPGDGALPQPRRLARASSCGSTSCLRLKVLPISLALPWGLNVGDFLGHIPLPAKITIEVLAADRPARAVRRRPRPRRGLRPRHRA